MLVSWDDTRGFGFASMDGEAQDVFVHVKFLRARHVRPVVGDRLRFALTEGRNGRPAANDIEIVGAPPPPPAPPSTPQPRPPSASMTAVDVSRLAAAVSILVGAVLSVTVGRAPVWFAALYLVMSFASGLLYWFDKQYAMTGRSRVRELSLHLSDALFGIAGGLFAQHVFRHKTRKKSFRYATRLIYIAHASLLIAVMSGLLRLDR